MTNNNNFFELETDLVKYKKLYSDLKQENNEIINLMQNQYNQLNNILEYRWHDLEDESYKDGMRYLLLLTNGWKQVGYYDIINNKWLLVCSDYIEIETDDIKVISWRKFD